MKMIRGAASAVLLGAGILGISSRASALAGTHPIVVSSWDARASTVALEYRHGFMKDGGFNDVAYNANFSSTSGMLSAQFGLHYVNFKAEAGNPTAHGLAATATALFEIPLTRRLDNGLPIVALAFAVGSAPTTYVSGSLNYVTIPLVLGVGVPITPAKVISFTPWFELSPSVNLDTEIKPYTLKASDITITPGSGVTLDESDVQRIVSDSVKLKTSVNAGARGGLAAALHLSDHVDFAADFALSSAGSAFSGKLVTYAGGGIVWRWDDIVAAVLPAEKRLLRENCDDIEARFRSCPNSRAWKRPEEATPRPATTPPDPATVTPAPKPVPPPPLAPTTAAPPPPAAAPPPPPPPAAPAPAPAPAPVGTTSFPP
jgi:hypothetical protein